MTNPTVVADGGLRFATNLKRTVGRWASIAIVGRRVERNPPIIAGMNVCVVGVKNRRKPDAKIGRMSDGHDE